MLFASAGLGPQSSFLLPLHHACDTCISIAGSSERGEKNERCPPMPPAHGSPVPPATAARRALAQQEAQTTAGRFYFFCLQFVPVRSFNSVFPKRLIFLNARGVYELKKIPCCPHTAISRKQERHACIPHPFMQCRTIPALQAHLTAHRFYELAIELLIFSFCISFEF